MDLVAYNDEQLISKHRAINFRENSPNNFVVISLNHKETFPTVPNRPYDPTNVYAAPNSLCYHTQHNRLGKRLAIYYSISAESQNCEASRDSSC
jgi:hypothetical protein